MQIIPAIDLKNGRCVRLQQGRFDEETAFSDDPVSVALRWEQEGATRLHVVDLDGARMGKPQHFPIIRTIAKSVQIPVQLGGGIRETAIIHEALDLGLDRVVVGTVAALDRDWAARTFQRFGQQVALGIDASDGKVAIRGWQEVTDRSAFDFAREMEALGAKRIVFTDIARDGMLQGPNLVSLGEMMKAVSIPVIASGGVSRLDDIKALRVLGPEGVIIGKALYTGDLDLADACRMASA
jgi:phosphoribosylformimino-5-aminoimidazole carboxamide ribotide isomerase